MTSWARLASAAAAVAVAAAAASAGAAATSPVRLAARLTPAQESPTPRVRPRKAVGAFAATVQATPSGYRLDWRLTFSRLTGRSTSADIHRGRRGAHGAAMLHLCSPCASGASGRVYFSSPELALARAGTLYVNVRTSRNPAGEIRGQIRVA